MASRTPAPAPPSRLNLPIFLLALFGVLVVVHLWIQVDRGFTHGCLGFSAPTGEIAECAGVVGSELGAIGGVSNVWLGLVFYLLLAGLRLGIALTRPPTSVRLRQGSFLVASGGMLYAIYLVAAQVFVLDQYCVLCLISAATTTVIFALHIVEWRRGEPAAAAAPAGKKKRGAATAPAVSLRPYVIGIAALVLLAAADVAFMGNGDDAPLATVPDEESADPFVPTSEQLAQACQYDPALASFALFGMLTSGQAGYDGSADAGTRVLKVFDPNCPACKTLHASMEHVVPQYRDQARFYYQPIALWEFSIPQIQALYLAREQGNERYMQMIDLQFERQRPGGIPVDTLVAFAQEIGMDAAAFRAELQRGKYASVIRSESQMIGGAGVNSVPKLFVEGRGILNTQLAWTPECLRYYVEQAR